MKSLDTINLLLKRRSVVAKLLQEPGPSRDELETILRCATRVPDHKGLSPWRIQVLDRASIDSFQKKLPALFSGDPAVFEKAQNKLPKSAPTMLVVHSHTISQSVPRFEQILSGGALCQNVLVASQALGYHAQWVTEWMAYSDSVKTQLNIPTSEDILGFIYIGTPPEAPKERPRPDLNSIVAFI